MKKRLVFLVLLFGFICSSAIAQKSSGRGITVGSEVDLLPYISGGYYASAWVGVDKWKMRLRPVIASVDVPDFALNEELNGNKVKAYALIADYFFRSNYEGFWLGTGLEYWEEERSLKIGGQKQVDDWFYTLGGGFVWKFWGNAYLNPWVAGHLRMSGLGEQKECDNSKSGETFIPELSLKFGWHF